MSASNLYGQPSPFLFFQAGGPRVQVQEDEAGRVQADEAGNVLQPDAPITTVQGDENSKTLTDENGAINLTEP